MITSLYIFFFAFALLHPALAFGQQDHGRSVQLIEKTVNHLCTTPSTEQSSHGIDLKLEAKANVDDLIKYFADAGFHAGARFQQQGSNGILQKDLAHTIENSNDCKRDLTKVFVAALLPSPAARSECQQKCLEDKRTCLDKVQDNFGQCREDKYTLQRCSSCDCLQPGRTRDCITECQGCTGAIESRCYGTRQTSTESCISDYADCSLVCSPR